MKSPGPQSRINTVLEVLASYGKENNACPELRLCWVDIFYQIVYQHVIMRWLIRKVWRYQGVIIKYNIGIIYKSNFFIIVYFDFIDVLHADNIFDDMILIKQLVSNYESIIHFNECLHVFADIILSLLSLEHHKPRVISLITAPLQTLRNLK